MTSQRQLRLIISLLFVLAAFAPEKFAGQYESKALPVEVSIEIVGGKLTAMVPGQRVYTLVPVALNRFQH